ncbi:MAG: alpha/beta fold hydrolase [Deltaproteobacteria bacterium]|nr:alpha/beta fold hydrolase [Deltaproteobacteria bacterium]MBN2670605.1 alpha/beta fold hydrolase [Deltaproteobacteria bacterium]
MNRVNVLFLHGFMGHRDFFSAIATAVRSQIPNACATSLPLPGHEGLTDELPISPMPAMFDEATTAVAANAQPSAQNWLVGYSMGARLALGTLLNHTGQFHGAVLFSVHPGIEDPEQRTQRLSWERELQQKLDRSQMMPLIEYFESLPVFDSQRRLPQPLLDAQRCTRLSHHPERISQCIAALGLGHSPDMTSLLDTITIPVLLITGELDATYTRIAAKIANHRSNIEHRIINDVGHNPILEAPQKSTEQVIAFIQKHSATTRSSPH